MAEIVVIGEILVEIMATEIGQTFTAPGLFEGPYPSGAPAIFADQAALMGASTTMIGCVGPDDFGTLNIERLKASGCDTSAIRRVPDTTTGIAFVTYKPDGSRDFLYTIPTSASAALHAEQLTPALFSDCRYFHVMGSSLFSNRIGKAVRKGVELARAAGAAISFDPNIRKELVALPDAAATIAYVLSVSDLLLPSEADLAYLHPGLSEADAAAALLAAGRRLVLVKRGAAGCAYYDAERTIVVAALSVTEVDPTGAGDCFGGTFVAGMTLGLPLERTLLLATAAGALAVQKKGPMEGNSTMATIDSFIVAQGR